MLVKGMNKFAIEIDYNSYKNKLGILVEAKDEDEARSIAQRHFLKTHPLDCILSSRVMKIDVTLIDLNPSQRNLESPVGDNE